ncbi:MAG TPA: CPBP family intramembrane glutamic endopeptidase, partial [Candidatus Limnocylindrales bacterium]|nr:CPBP family intramembrane glutamic endopeptidase [Candidatus Limnocylindrales bacterium]
NYAARVRATRPPPPDVLFAWSTAIGTFALDGVVLLFVLLIARGLPFRDAFALRPPASWSNAARIAALALIATWGTSLVLELTVGHAAREQGVPQFWDPDRLPAFAANAVAIALFAPFVEEMLCRGVGFTLLEGWGERAAIGGTAVAFALAHGAVLDLPWVLVTGLGLGYLRARSGSLYPCLALHATVNGIAVIASALVARAA